MVSPDNFEWARGFSVRFGLYRVDYKTKERIATMNELVDEDLETEA